MLRCTLRKIGAAVRVTRDEDNAGIDITYPWLHPTRMPCRSWLEVADTYISEHLNDTKGHQTQLHGLQATLGRQAKCSAMARGNQKIEARYTGHGNSAANQSPAMAHWPWRINCLRAKAQKKAADANKGGSQLQARAAGTRQHSISG